MTPAYLRRFALAVLAIGALAGPAHAVLPSEQLADPKLEARARAIGAELRCLVCQNQSIDDSDALLAGDLRVLLRERLLAGDTDAQAKQFIVRRYGNYVLLNPPVEGQTLLLWLGPLIVLVGGGVWVASLAARRRGPVADLDADLTPEERAALAQRLDAGSAST